MPPGAPGAPGAPRVRRVLVVLVVSDEEELPQGGQLLVPQHEPARGPRSRGGLGGHRDADADGGAVGHATAWLVAARVDRSAEQLPGSERSGEGEVEVAGHPRVHPVVRERGCRGLGEGRRPVRAVEPGRVGAADDGGLLGSDGSRTQDRAERRLKVPRIPTDRV